MANLKDTVVLGKLNVTDKVIADKIIKLGGTTYEVLLADGTIAKISPTTQTVAPNAVTTNAARTYIVQKNGDQLVVNVPWVKGESSGGTLTEVNLVGGDGIALSSNTIDSDSDSITISHDDTSDQDSIETGGRTYINSITLDDYGHVTSLGTGTETNQDLSNYVTLNGAQTISGVKTFTGSMKVSGRYANGGDDEGIIIGRASNSYAGLCLGEPSGLRSVFYLTSNNQAIWRYNNGTTSYDIQHPGKTGTIALTSDIPSISGYVTGSGLTADYIVLGNGSSSIKKGSCRITTDIESNDTHAYIPTAESVSDYVRNQISDKKTSSSSQANTELKLVGAIDVSTDGVETFTNPNCYIGTDNCLYSNGKKVATEEWVLDTVTDVISQVTIKSQVYYNGSWVDGWRDPDAAVEVNPNKNSASSYTMATVSNNNQTITLRYPYSSYSTKSRWLMTINSSGLSGISINGVTPTKTGNNYKIQFISATSNQTITIAKGEVTFKIKIQFNTASFVD